jgi:DNA-binding NarL/FixJ family response regulator
MRVIVAEDGILRDLLVRTLPDHGLEISGQARTTQELIRLVAEEPPDIVITDIKMPRSDSDTEPAYDAGMEAAREIRRRYPDVAILALSQHAEVPWAEEIATLGMKVGYLLKDRVEDMEGLVDTVRAVASGDIRIDATLIAALARRQRLNDPVQRLSPREREVLELMAEGLSDVAIAKRLYLAESTVEGHARSIYQKLELSTSTYDTAERPAINVRVKAVLALLRYGRVKQPPPP